MFVKLLLLYNLAVLTAVGVAGVKSAGSVSGLALPLLLIPLLYHLTAELVRRKRAAQLQPEPVKLEKSLPLLKGKVEANVSDRDRRLFLKLIGSTGLSLFFMSLVSKEAQATFFGSLPGPGTVSLKDSAGNKIDPAEKSPTDGYKISQLDDSGATYLYFGYVNKDGAWYIQRETVGGGGVGDYRYFKGSTNFATNWSNRANLNYDEFENIF